MFSFLNMSLSFRRDLVPVNSSANPLSWRAHFPCAKVNVAAKSVGHGKEMDGLQKYACTK